MATGAYHSPLHIIGIILLWIIGIMTALVFALLVFIATPYFSATLGAYLTNESGRNVALDGRVETRLISREPRLILKGVKVGNADWSRDETMFEAEHIEVSVRALDLLRLRLTLPELILVSPKLILEKNTQGEANWHFGENPQAAAVDAVAPEESNDLPVIQHLQIRDGILTYRDAKKKIDSTLKVSTVQAESDTDKEESLIISGKGNFQNAPFLLEARGASVLQLREGDKPYPFSLNTTLGATRIVANGTVRDIVALDAVDVNLHIKGKNAADLFPITGIALPPTPPYDVAGHLTSENEIYRFTHFKGKLGSSDLKGDVAWHPAQKPPYFEGKFISDNLDMADLKGLIGANKRPEDKDRVLPDTPLDISRLVAMNADVSFSGRKVRAPDLLDDFYMNVHLEDGVLRVKPLSFGIAKGKITAEATIKGLEKPPHMQMTVKFQRLDITELFSPLAERYGKDNVSAGVLGGTAQLSGRGRSLRDVLATSNGTLGIGMEGGSLSRLLLNIVGLDIFRVTGLLLTGRDEPIDIHCVVAGFQARKGILETQEFLIDTDVNTVRGTGNVSLRDESMDLRLTVHPKEASPVSARSPIRVRGTFKDPSVGVDAAALAARGGIGAALGALLTPAAALLAFIDPSLGQESDCAEFIHKLDQSTGARPPAQ